MSRVFVTLKDVGTGKERLVIMPNTDVDTVLNTLVEQPLTEAETVRRFLDRTGADVSIETPDSSNVRSISYNEASETIRFNFDGDSYSEYVSSFDKFLDALKAPSAGKLQWKYRRGEV
jgi:hypothetical protein